jgi:hypothetical protein
MTGADIIDVLLGVVLGLFGFIIKYILGRTQDNQTKIDDLRVDLATQGQENKELYSHIKRIDINLSEIFKKLDELIVIMRNNHK